MEKFKEILCSEFCKLIDVTLNKFNYLNSLNNEFKFNLKIQEINFKKTCCKIIADFEYNKKKYELADIQINFNNNHTVIERNNYINSFFSKFNKSNVSSNSKNSYNKENLNFQTQNKNSVEFQFYKKTTKKNRVLPKDIYIKPEHRAKIVNQLKTNFDLSYLKIFEYRYNENFEKRLNISIICSKINLSPPGVYRKLYKITELYDKTK